MEAEAAQKSGLDGEREGATKGACEWANRCGRRAGVVVLRSMAGEWKQGERQSERLSV